MPANRRDFYVGLHVTKDGNGLALVAHDADQAADSIDHAGTSTKHFSNDLTKLNHDIDESRRRVHAMHMEFARTRDDTIFGDLRKEEQNLRRLERTARNLTGAMRGGQGLAGGFDFSQSGAELRYMAIAALVEVGVVAAPVLGSMIAGAVIGGVGLGGIVGGTVAAAKDPRVKEAFGDLFKQMGGDVKQDASSFVDPLVQAASIFGDDWAAISVKLDQAFRTLAPGIEPLAHGIGGLANQLADGFNVAAKAALPIMKDMEQELPRLGASLELFLKLLSDPKTDARGGFHDLMIAIDALVLDLGLSLSALAATWKKFKDMPRWEQIVDILIPSAGLTDLFRTLSQSFGEAATDAAGEVSSAMSGAVHSISGASGTIQLLTGDFVDLGDAVDTAAYETKLFNEAVSKTNQPSLDFLGAQIRIEETFDRLAEAVREHGKSLDIDTEAGRENLTLIGEAADEAEAAARKKLAETHSVYDAQAVYEQYRQKLYDVLTALHFNRDAIQQIIDKYLALSLLPDITKKVRFTLGPVPNATFGGGFQEFAEGGFVMGPKGSPQMIVAHAGEQVLTDQQQRDYAMAMSGMSGGSSSAITISFAATGDPFLDALVKELRRFIRVEGGTGSDSVQVAFGQS